MKKDTRFWILIGALVIVAGLFAAFLWSVMAAPAEPTTVDPALNTSVTVEPTANELAPAPVPSPTDGKPVDPIADIPPPIAIPTPAIPPEAQQQLQDAQARIREARERMERVRREAAARARQARERADQLQRRSRRAADDKPPMEDDKPPADY